MEADDATRAEIDDVGRRGGERIPERALGTTGPELAVDFDRTGTERRLAAGASPRFNINGGALRDLGPFGVVVAVPEGENAAAVDDHAEHVVPLRADLEVIASGEDVVHAREGEAAAGGGDAVNPDARVPGIGHARTEGRGGVGDLAVDARPEESATVTNRAHVESLSEEGLAELQGGVVNAAEVGAIEHGRVEIVVEHDRTEGGGAAHRGEIGTVDTAVTGKAERAVGKDANGTGAERSAGGGGDLHVAPDDVGAAGIGVTGVADDDAAKGAVTELGEGAGAGNNASQLEGTGRAVRVRLDRGLRTEDRDGTFGPRTIEVTTG